MNKDSLSLGGFDERYEVLNCSAKNVSETIDYVTKRLQAICKCAVLRSPEKRFLERWNRAGLTVDTDTRTCNPKELCQVLTDIHIALGGALGLVEQRVRVLRVSVLLSQVAISAKFVVKSSEQDDPSTTSMARNGLRYALNTLLAEFTSRKDISGRGLTGLTAYLVRRTGDMCNRFAEEIQGILNENTPPDNVVSSALKILELSELYVSKLVTVRTTYDGLIGFKLDQSVLGEPSVVQRFAMGLVPHLQRKNLERLEHGS